jgi:hypothetical protein
MYQIVWFSKRSPKKLKRALTPAVCGYVCCMKGMFNRLRYLYHEGFDVCAIMGYDNKDQSDAYGEGSILYRVQNENHGWRVMSETFEVGYDEMQACSSFYVNRILR